MIDWNLGDILDAIEPVMPKDAPALIHGDRIVTWPEMSRRSNNLARNLRERGAGSGAKVAFYMRNRPEYGELIAACEAQLHELSSEEQANVRCWRKDHDKATNRGFG